VTGVKQADSGVIALSGLLVVDKPLGWSSMDVVRRVRRAAGGAKTGHAGTLDPLATGVVVCCLGRATQSVEHLMGLTKVYLAEVDLSAFTATDDREGERQEISVNTPPSEELVREALSRFVGQVEQKPPIYSAIHVGGKRAYKMARRGEQFELPTRVVRIDSVELLSYTWPLLTIQVVCGKGTYIRSIARELGERLGTGGHLASLRRESVGGYDLSMAVDEARLERPITTADLLAVPSPGE
jgi:tRNA pseudouridine55 synthase